MMYSIDCANAWRKICSTYDETKDDNSPVLTAKKIVNRVGLYVAIKVFATVAEIKKNDTRISEKNRIELRRYEVYRGSVELSHTNPLFNTGLLDHIHTTQLDRIITEVLKLR